MNFGLKLKKKAMLSGILTLAMIGGLFASLNLKGVSELEAATAIPTNYRRVWFRKGAGWGTDVVTLQFFGGQQQVNYPGAPLIYEPINDMYYYDMFPNSNGGQFFRRNAALNQVLGQSQANINFGSFPHYGYYQSSDISGYNFTATFTTFLASTFAQKLDTYDTCLDATNTGFQDVPNLKISFYDLLNETQRAILATEMIEGGKTTALAKWNKMQQMYIATYPESGYVPTY